MVATSIYLTFVDSQYSIVFKTIPVHITCTLAMQMKKKNLKRGVASLCIGGGQGMSIVIERP